MLTKWVKSDLIRQLGGRNGLKYVVARASGWSSELLRLSVVGNSGQDLSPARELTGNEIPTVSQYLKSSAYLKQAGIKKKSANEEPEEVYEEAPTEVPKVKRKRGRPKKVSKPEDLNPKEKSEGVPKKRGRPKKKDLKKDLKEDTREDPIEKPKRGRPKKKDNKETSEDLPQDSMEDPELKKFSNPECPQVSVANHEPLSALDSEENELEQSELVKSKEEAMLTEAILNVKYLQSGSLQQDSQEQATSEDSRQAISEDPQHISGSTQQYPQPEAIQLVGTTARAFEKQPEEAESKEDKKEIKNTEPLTIAMPATPARKPRTPRKSKKAKAKKSTKPIEESIDLSAWPPPLPVIADEELLRQVFTHTSSTLDSTLPRILQHNKRLEFMGDAILSSALTTILCDTYPLADSGGLTKMKDQMVSNKTLSRIGMAYSLHTRLIVSAERQIYIQKLVLHKSKLDKAKLIADVFEAYVAGLYKDRGYEAVVTWLRELYAPLMYGRMTMDDKEESKLQEVITYQQVKRWSVKIEYKHLLVDT